MNKLPPELLKELQDEYLNNIPGIITEIKSSARLNNWAEVQTLFHRFAGNGKTYGMAEISDLGRAAELYLQKTKTPSLPLIENTIKNLESVIDSYRARTEQTKEQKKAIEDIIKELAA